MTMQIPMHDFTVIYTFSKRIGVDGSVKIACYHHLARVKAPNAGLAVERCRADMLPNHTFDVIAVFDGTPRVADLPLSTRIQEFTHGEPV